MAGAGGDEAANGDRFQRRSDRGIQRWVRFIPTRRLLLCRLVGLLEKRSIEGVESKPKSKAQARNNIHKALEVLQKKNTMPLTSLYCDDEIVAGNPHTILTLLTNLQQAYKNCLHQQDHPRFVLPFHESSHEKPASSLRFNKTAAQSSSSMNSSLTSKDGRLSLLPPSHP